ncbi:threonine--tRNA ligase [Patescibacteria group bacterium]|nr:threonine--tRNA ligase [Patescibacteria group bacterium]
MGKKNDLTAMRHSLAHILAASVVKLWPAAQFGVGPTTEDGFFYDLKIPGVTLTEADLKNIEEGMKDIIAQDVPFEQYSLPVNDAIAWARETHQPYKEELLNDLQREGTTAIKDLNYAEIGVAGSGPSKVDQVSFYKSGDFVDLCRGPHVASSGKVGAFKLLRVSGAYWRGDINKDQLQRVYGVAFSTQQELKTYLENLAKAKQVDHRKLGQELDLFVISDLVGPGLPLFTPRGTVLRNQLIAFSEELQRDGGYEAVWTPHITRIELYKRSGHYDKYPERFEVKSVESEDTFMLKPMNCPHVTQIYASRPRSYRDLPKRYMETTTLYRDEKSGELHGLSRVRALTQDDSHAFVRIDQVESEFRSIISMVKQMYLVLGMPLSVDLSFRDDSDRYLGDKKLWREAEEAIEKIAKEETLDYRIVKGEAAFYGPKIDIHVRDALGRKWQCATIQLDYVQPERFNLEYVDRDGSLKRPVMIHKAILGSVERFLSVYIEHTSGKFPVWLAPEQIRILTLNDAEPIISFASEIEEEAKRLDLRCSIDAASESVSKKIRQAEMLKIPYVVVIGPKEVESHEVLPRIRTDMVVQERKESLSVEEFLKTVAHEAKSRITHTSL